MYNVSKDIINSLKGLFVQTSDLNEFLLKIGKHIVTESSITKRLEDIESIALTGSLPRTHRPYDPFAPVPVTPAGPSNCNEDSHVLSDHIVSLVVDAASTESRWNKVLYLYMLMTCVVCLWIQRTCSMTLGAWAVHSKEVVRERAASIDLGADIGNVVFEQSDDPGKIRCAITSTK